MCVPSLPGSPWTNGAARQWHWGIKSTGREKKSEKCKRCGLRQGGNRLPQAAFSDRRLPAGVRLKRNRELAEAIRATAFFLWEQDGKPEGRAFDYWVRAKEQHLRQMAYDRWLAEGSPHGRDADIWYAVSRELDESK